MKNNIWMHELEKEELNPLRYFRFNCDGFPQDKYELENLEILDISNRLALDLAVNGVVVLKKDEYKKLLSSLKHGYSAWVIHTLYIAIEALKSQRKFLTAFKCNVKEFVNL